MSSLHPIDRKSSEKTTTMDEDTGVQLMEVNETGHVQELERNFSLLSICAVGLVTGCTWAALGGSIVVAIYNGGPPGVLYEFIVVSVFYWCIAASIAELASAMPSSAGVYHWASLTPGLKYGPICGWFAGYWNTSAWLAGTASMASISAQIVVTIYSLYHPSYVSERWHIFIVYVIITWLCCCTVLFANRALPMINNIGLFFIMAGVVITILVCAIMPSQTGTGHASSSFVWSEWDNQTGYSSNGFVFLAGMLNGAYAVGTPDCVSHLAEEIPNPRRNIPLAIAAQMVIGFITAFLYLIAIFYSISDIDLVLASPYLPLATIYAQATSSTAGTVGLLFLVLVPVVCTLIGNSITTGRCVWTLARDGAVPFSGTLGKVDARFKMPFNATVFCGVFTTVLGAIYVGSPTAFSAFIGAFIVLSTLSYLAAILPFVLTRRFSHGNQPAGPYVSGVRPGWFVMKGMWGWLVNAVSCAYIVVFVVIYCWPYGMPVTVEGMNYASVIVGGISLWAGLWWCVKGGSYEGPQALVHESGEAIVRERKMVVKEG